MILLLTFADDSHTDHVAAQLRDRGARFVRFDPGDFPRAAEISISHGSGPRLRTSSEEVDLDAVTAIWYRRPEKPVPHEAITDPTVRRYVELECGLFIQDLWCTLRARWLPGSPLLVRRAEHKAFGLRVARELGFELPPTLITNSPSDLIAFYREHGGAIVSKQAATAFSSTIGFRAVRYTELVTTRDIAHAHEIAYCPMTFQAYVPKRVELRITVVGTRVFAAEIHSQVNHHTRFDWRRYDLDRTPHHPHELPADVERRCVALVERLGLRYGAIDMIVTPEGRYVFLEINPNGQYLWIEQQTGLPISDAICELLMSTAEPGRAVSAETEALRGEPS